MEDRLARLEARLEELTAAVRGIEVRMARLESAPATPVRVPPESKGTPPAADAAVSALDHSAFATVLGFIGRSCLVLGGAFLIRALTESGVVPRAAGVVLGLAFAVAWVLVADRVGRRGARLSAGFHGIVGVSIAYPLLWETTVRYKVLSPPLAAVAVAALAGVSILVARRRDLRALAWTATLGAIATSIAVLIATHTVEAFTGVLILLGAASVWLGYDRHWHGLRWPVAIVTDAVVLQATIIAARPGGPQPPWERVSLPGVAALALLLLVVYLGAFAARILRRHRDVTVFEVVQTALAVSVGFGGLMQVARAAGWPGWPIGAGALATGAACYAVAFAFVERRTGAGRSFFFFSSLALVLVLAGSGPAVGRVWVGAFWSLVGLGAAALAARFARMTLKVHGAIYLLAGALASGLLVWAWDALLAAASTTWHRLTPPSLLVFVAAILSYLLLTPGSGDTRPWFMRLPALVAAVIAALSALALAIAAVSPALGHGEASDAGALAAVRTALLALAAVAFAALGRRARFRELGWLVYPILALGGAKLLLEDFARGHATTLFPALAFYGAALIVAPRLLRRRRASP